MIDATLVTIHGFGSSPATWDRLNAIWSADKELRGLLIDPFGYPSPRVPRQRPFSTRRIPDYDDVSQSFANRYEVHYRDAAAIVIVTHSQGGLILQRFLVWMLREGRGRELARIRTIVMLACPNNGSQYLSSLRNMLGYDHSPQARSLETLDKQVADAQRTVLQRVVYATGVDDLQCRIPFHVYAGDSDQIVPAASAQAAFPRAGVLPGDHFSILDPGAPGNATAETVKHYILADLAAAQASPPATAGSAAVPPAAAAPAVPPAAASPSGRGERYRIDIRDSQGVVIGDHSHVHQSFGTPPPRAGAEEDDTGERA
jgi:pimeloyl-ACP methyl ester carboxylesterase